MQQDYLFLLDIKSTKDHLIYGMQHSHGENSILTKSLSLRYLVRHLKALSRHAQTSMFIWWIGFFYIYNQCLVIHVRKTFNSTIWWVVIIQNKDVLQYIFTWRDLPGFCSEWAVPLKIQSSRTRQVILTWRICKCLEASHLVVVQCLLLTVRSSTIRPLLNRCTYFHGPSFGSFKSETMYIFWTKVFYCCWKTKSTTGKLSTWWFIYQFVRN